MIHKACMPVYMNSGKIVADGWTGRDGTGGESKVLQEVLADLKMGAHKYLYVFFQEFPFNKKDFKGRFWQYIK